MPELPTDFEDRDALVAFCREAFTEAAAVSDDIPPADQPGALGGRAAAEAQLESVKPARYGKTRNFFDGDVTRLSAYLRHGVLSLSECRDHALTEVGKSGAYKLINELAWRDYFQRCLDRHGEGVRDNIEDWKTGLDDADYAL